MLLEATARRHKDFHELAKGRPYVFEDRMKQNELLTAIIAEKRKVGLRHNLERLFVCSGLCGDAPYAHQIILMVYLILLQDPEPTERGADVGGGGGERCVVRRPSHQLKNISLAYTASLIFHIAV